MNRQNSTLHSFWRMEIVFIGFVLLALCGLYFFNIFAQAGTVKKPSEHDLGMGRLAYSTGVYGPFPGRSISIADPDGSGVMVVPVADNRYPNEPAWSPDGTKIAFASNQGPFDIYVINTDGGEQTNLTNTEDPARESNPSWSVTGKIAYESKGQIWTMDSDGTAQAQFSAITQPLPSDPAWSPDGLRMAFVSGGDIWVINANGTDEQRVTNTPSMDADPAWSPDGSRIAFAKTGSGLSVVDAGGTNEMPLTLDASDITPTWSPDGTQIAFRRGGGANRGINTIDVDGTNRTRILADLILFPLCCDSLRENPAWQPLRAPSSAPFDFDGDGRSDISVFRSSDGVWYLRRSTAGFSALQWGLSNDLLTPADYDGDLKTDVAVWRESDGNFYVLNSFDGTFRIENLGVPGDIPALGDWDGDGKADPAVYRDGVQSTIYYRGSMGNPLGSITSIDWGTTGDKPVVGDFDGDGRTDPAVFRPSSGIWYVRQSSNGQWVINNFGLAGDVLVPADYDGDGKTDIAVFRDGIWYLSRSLQGFTAFHFGTAGDIPAPADYDGDGHADATIFRNGEWWILNTQSGSAEAYAFGLGGDRPIPSAFVR